MKKLVLPLIALIVGFVVGHYLIINKQNLAPATLTETHHSTENYALPEKIPYADAKKMVGLYNPGLVPRSIGGTTIQTSNTKCVWFGIKEMASLIGEIVSEHGDGIRIYFGTYDKNTTGYDSGGNAVDYSNLNTVVIVSTRDSVSNYTSYHSDYYKPTTHSLNKISYLVADPTNKGELCPPPSNCKIVGAYLVK